MRINFLKYGLFLNKQNCNLVFSKKVKIKNCNLVIKIYILDVFICKKIILKAVHL